MRKAFLATIMLALAGSVLTTACGDDEDNGGDGSPDGADGGDGNTDGEPTDGEDGEPTDGEDGEPTDGEDGNTGLTECPDHPAISESPDGTLCVITGSITAPINADLTLAPVEGKMGYAIADGVFVGEDVGGAAEPAAGKKAVTLTIEPGTTIYGVTPLAFLLINRGSKIEAVGTAEAPIVFTSLPEAGAAQAPGQWGGLVINGRALHNQGVDIEGEAGTGLYGGVTEDDNSGTLKYVRVEFGGGKVDAENELNGIAFQGVGSGTTVDYVQVHGNDDDGIEFFGGSVNVKHVLVTASGDDAFDWTSGYTGKAQYVIGQQWSYVSSSDPNGIEADNDRNAPAQTPRSLPTLANFTLIGAGAEASLGANLRRGTGAHIYSAVVTGYAKGCLQVDGPDSAALVGTDLTLASSRIQCTTSFSENEGSTATQDLFEFEDAGNEVVADLAAQLEDATSRTPNFAPVSGSALLEGGTTPDDDFFTAETFIGAIGTEDWTAGWTKVTDFEG